MYLALMCKYHIRVSLLNLMFSVLFETHCRSFIISYSLQGMKSMVIKVMAECDRLKASSVAFPALGTGNLGFPSDVAAKIMVQSAHHYLQENPNSSLRKVVFIIYQDEVFSAFQRELSALTLAPTISTGAQPPSPELPMQDSLLSHASSPKSEEPIPIVAVKGPLIEAQVGFSLGGEVWELIY